MGTSDSIDRDPAVGHSQEICGPQSDGGPHSPQQEFAWLSFTNSTDVAFALRTTLAGIAVLFTTMWLQIDVPRWAVWTVFVVSPPVRGNALRKTASRLVGTVIGCIAAVAITALFPQERIGYFVVFSAWLGGCAYWATFRRGYVSYAAVLAAFTSAIVAAEVSSMPLHVWRAAVDRGSATFLGTLFAFFASEMSARSDDVPRDLANRVRALASDQLCWAANLLVPGKSKIRKDAPFTARILALDEIITNASAERSGLNWVKPWIAGIPTALLSLQSAVLRVRDTAAHSGTTSETRRAGTDVLENLVAFLRSPASLDLPSLQRQSASLAGLRSAQWAQAPALQEIINAICYLTAGLEAIMDLTPPRLAPPLYPPPKFVAHPHYATTNLIRTVVGIVLGFIIWDVTAWTHGDIFLVYIAVGVVMFVANDDPVAGNWPNLIGNLIGGVVALAAKYLLLVRANEPVCLMIILFVLLFIGALAETKTKLASLGLFYINGLLVLMAPENPQKYDFVQDVNIFIAFVLAYSFVPMIFVAIGTPRKGPERIAELLAHMRQRRRLLSSDLTREQRLCWQTEMYDELQRLQAVTADPRVRDYGVNLLLFAWRTPEAFRPRSPSQMEST
ncbi:MAG TPA: FUSC family protein [Phycisphaerae bacterium]|nr:FUSC family protein [Phycisphaerae bacterium]